MAGYITPHHVYGFSSLMPTLETPVGNPNPSLLPDNIFSGTDTLNTLCHDLLAFGWWVV